MPPVTEKRPTSFADYVAYVEKLGGSASKALWFRGAGKSKYRLVPSLYRHKTKKTPADLAELEHQIMTRFRQRSVPFHSRPLEDDWEALFFMQHYGVPTRLLDWTENPFVGLYFAVMSAQYKTGARGTITFSDDAAVWILDPVIWNKHSLSHQTYDLGILAPGDEELKSYKPNPTFSKMNNHPVAVFGTHNSARIVAQRGTFVLFGQNTAPMEAAFDKAGFPQGSLTKVILGKGILANMRKSVLNNGMTESVVFPDLDGLAREIKRLFHFEV